VTHVRTTTLGPVPRYRHKTLFFMVLLAYLASGCAKPLLTCPRAVKVPDPPLPWQHPAPVLFATDRLPETGEKLSFLSELNPSGNHLSYGAKCEDPTGRPAICDDPSVWLERDEFLQRVAAAKTDVVLFVHGFRYSFDESLAITLRIVERAQVHATPVSYSWPSQDKLAAYADDYDMSEWTIAHLTDFIRDLVQALPEGAVLHIVAQSMGNRPLLEALARLNLPKQRLGQLIMIAPDVDTQIFRELVLHSGPFARRTLYVSNHDLALRAAGFLHSRAGRAGDARKQYVVIKEVDTIDASPLKTGVTGHSVYEFPQLMFDDLGAVLKDEGVTGRKLAACTVKSIERANTAQGTSLPCVVYRLPRN
jgi:Alpha/beta hydrolase of unknown function (DUF900)